MRTNDENKMYKLYESTNRKKQMISYIMESTRRNPWLFFDEQGPVAGTPITPEAPVMDPTASDPTDGEDPEKAKKMEMLQTALMDLTAEELIGLMQKVVVAQQEAAAGGEGQGLEDLTAGEASAQSPDMAEVPPPPVV